MCCGDTMARGYTMGMSLQDTITYLYCGDFPFCNYWEPEYYLKPLSGTQRLLRPVSNYLKATAISSCRSFRYPSFHSFKSQSTSSTLSP